MIGRLLLPAVARTQPEMAARITGMMLELGNHELLAMLESRQHLEGRIGEAMGMLDAARAVAEVAAEAATLAAQTEDA
eukprot:732293-Lingulodinium_polyedra.AAC.1